MSQPNQTNSLSKLQMRDIEAIIHQLSLVKHSFLSLDMANGCMIFENKIIKHVTAINNIIDDIKGVEL